MSLWTIPLISKPPNSQEESALLVMLLDGDLLGWSDAIRP